jgi:hypothetical protein
MAQGLDPQKILRGFGNIWQLRSTEDVNMYLQGQDGVPSALRGMADAAASGTLPFAPSSMGSAYQNFINSGGAWQEAPEVATAESMMAMHNQNKVVQKTIQTDQKHRAQQAAKNMLQIFPEFTFDAEPLPPYSDALTEFSRSFGVSPKAVLDEIKQVTQGPEAQRHKREVESTRLTEASSIKAPPSPPYNPMTGLPDLLPPGMMPVSTRVTQTEDPFSAYTDLDENLRLLEKDPAGNVDGDPKVSTITEQFLEDFEVDFSGMNAQEILSRYRDSLEPGYEGPSISRDEAFDASMAYLEKVGVTLSTEQMKSWESMYDWKPSVSPVHVDPGLGGGSKEDIEREILTILNDGEPPAPTGYTDDRPLAEKEIDPYNVFSGYEDPAGAIFESVLRQKLGRRANNPRILNASMRGASHALGNWFLRQLDVDKNYGELSYHGYLSEDDPSLYRSTPAMSRQSYERMVRAARAAYNEADYNSLTWVRDDELPAWYSAGMEGPTPPGEAISYNRLLTIGEVVRNPTYEKSIAMAQAGITGKGIMGELQMKGIDGLWNRWQNEQIADPSQERRTFLAFLSTLKNTPWHVESPEGTETDDRPLASVYPE